MQWQKGFTLDGNALQLNLIGRIYIQIGIFGAVLSVFGNLQPVAQVYYVVGSMLLLLTAIYFRLIYFIALEIIFLSGHGAILLGIGPKLQLALPLLLSTQLMVFYFLSGQLTNIFIVFGIIGIALLSIGFAYQNQLIFFIGGTLISIYAFYTAINKKPALIWGVLNSFFALSALYKLIFLS